MGLNLNYLIYSTEIISQKFVGKIKPKKEKQRKRNKEELQNNWKTRIKMAIGIYLSIIILNVNGINDLIRRHRVAGWIKKKQEPTICCPEETHFRAKDTNRLKIRG